MVVFEAYAHDSMDMHVLITKIIAAKTDETKTVWRKKINTIKEKKRTFVLINFPFSLP